MKHVNMCVTCTVLDNTRNLTLSKLNTVINNKNDKLNITRMLKIHQQNKKQE
jgi:hypothetical protein